VQKEYQETSVDSSTQSVGFLTSNLMGDATVKQGKETPKNKGYSRSAKGEREKEANSTKIMAAASSILPDAMQLF
jgi:hypothetical protein